MLNAIASQKARGAAAPPPVVVKLGGSLVEAGTIRAWLSVVVAATRPTVVVPGGGAFTDAVRAAQAALGFDDRAAHEMALLAMRQTGVALAGLEPRLAPAETLVAIRRTIRAGKVPVLMPARLILGDPDLPASWTVTSDAIAARLAERLRARDLVLVKSAPAADGEGAAALAARGMVDPALPAIVARAGLRLAVTGPGEERRLAEMVGAA